MKRLKAAGHKKLHIKSCTDEEGCTSNHWSWHDELGPVEDEEYNTKIAFVLKAMSESGVLEACLTTFVFCTDNQTYEMEIFKDDGFLATLTTRG